MARINRVPKDTVVYKKAFSMAAKECIVVLLLKKGTRINRAISSQKKNRAEKAKVLRIHRVGHVEVQGGGFSSYIRKDTLKKAISSIDNSFCYVPERTVKPRNGYSCSPMECAGGIHFFSSLERAVEFPR